MGIIPDNLMEARMDQNTMKRILEGLDILEEALSMDDAERLERFGTASLLLVLATIRRLMERSNDL